MVTTTDQSNDVNATAPREQSIAGGPPTRSNFQDRSNHVVDFAHERNVSTGEDLPPEFIPYQAKFFIAENGCIISHDAHLNEDGT
jgi:hypothetical protein